MLINLSFIHINLTFLLSQNWWQRLTYTVFFKPTKKSNAFLHRPDCYSYSSTSSKYYLQQDLQFLLLSSST